MILLLLALYFYKNMGNYEDRLKNLLLNQAVNRIDNSSNNIIHRMLQDYPEFIYINKKDSAVRIQNENRISDLLSEEVKAVYVLYPYNNQLFYLLDSSSTDRGEVGELFTPIAVSNFEKVLKEKKTGIFIQSTIDDLGFTLIKPILQDSEIIAFLILDYKESSVATLSSLLNVSVKTIFYAIAFSLFLLFMLMCYIIYTNYVRYTIYHNPETNTLNRVYLRDNYDKINFKDYYIALVDLDFFKRVNNIYGQENGDRVIVSIMKRISTLLRTEDMFIQYGGEEFLLFISKDTMDEHGLKKLLEEIRVLVKNTNFIIADSRFSVTISIGVIIATELEKSLQDSIHKADTALYESKHSGRNKVCYFDLTQSERIYREKLKEMIESDKLVCYYQPIRRLSDGKLHHYEALLRIEDGDNIIFPDKILPSLEDSYLYSFLTKRVIEYNVNILRMDSNMKISINLSADDLINDAILSLLAQNADLSNRLHIEILENKSIDYQKVELSLQKLKLFGYKICIDDFGSGYSNLNHLLNLSIDYLKIDGSIITEILSDKKAYSLVQTFALFSQQNNIEVIAEFIDNQQTVDVLKEFGVEYGQGFYFSKAIPYRELKREEIDDL